MDVREFRIDNRFLTVFSGNNRRNMAEFGFTTVWRIQAPLSQVCDAFSRCRPWPRRRRGMAMVEVFSPGDAEGVGGMRCFTRREGLPWRFIFDVRVIRIVVLTMPEGR